MNVSQLNLPLGECADIISPTCPIDGVPLPSGRPSPLPDRLFVPLASAPFDWFRSGRKKWELRRLGRQYTTSHVRPGRTVELRRGYSDPSASLWGRISEVKEAASIEDFFLLVPWRTVLPESGCLEDAIADARRILNVGEEGSPVLGFRIELAGG